MEDSKSSDCPRRYAAKARCLVCRLKLVGVTFVFSARSCLDVVMSTCREALDFNCAKGSCCSAKHSAFCSAYAAVQRAGVLGHRQTRKRSSRGRGVGVGGRCVLVELEKRLSSFRDKKTIPWYFRRLKKAEWVANTHKLVHVPPHQVAVHGPVQNHHFQHMHQTNRIPLATEKRCTLQHQRSETSPSCVLSRSA